MELKVLLSFMEEEEKTATVTAYRRLFEAVGSEGVKELIEELGSPVRLVLRLEKSYRSGQLKSVLNGVFERCEDYNTKSAESENYITGDIESVELSELHEDDEADITDSAAPEEEGVEETVAEAERDAEEAESDIASDESPSEESEVEIPEALAEEQEPLSEKRPLHEEGENSPEATEETPKGEEETQTEAAFPEKGMEQSTEPSPPEAKAGEGFEEAAASNLIAEELQKFPEDEPAPQEKIEAEAESGREAEEEIEAPASEETGSESVELPEEEDLASEEAEETVYADEEEADEEADAEESRTPAGRIILALLCTPLIVVIAAVGTVLSAVLSVLPGAACGLFGVISWYFFAYALQSMTYIPDLLLVLGTGAVFAGFALSFLSLTFRLLFGGVKVTYELITDIYSKLLGKEKKEDD